ncbi:MAG: hypothetical protein R3185_06480, partial [Candidatus Thermoplasmatota archaeon]|nr:hypothetical protein [Candidatus Thermoplasmatota archaeon]
EAEVQEAPDMQTINAETAEAAADEGAEALTDAGVGTWNVTVTITAGQALPGPGSPSYTVGLTPGYTLWEANATPPTPGGSGGP